MIRHCCALLFLLAPACASAREARATEESAPAELFTYRASIEGVPASASNLALSVRVPGALHPLRANGLVGNAPFDFELPDPLPGATWSVGLTAKDAKLICRQGAQNVHELLLETRGRPVELTLRLSLPAGSAMEASALEQELTRGTSASADGVAIEGIATRLERVKVK